MSKRPATICDGCVTARYASEVCRQPCGVPNCECRCNRGAAPRGGTSRTWTVAAFRELDERLAPTMGGKRPTVSVGLERSEALLAITLEPPAAGAPLSTVPGTVLRCAQTMRDDGRWTVEIVRRTKDGSSATQRLGPYASLWEACQVAGQADER